MPGTASFKLQSCPIKMFSYEDSQVLNIQPLLVPSLNDYIKNQMCYMTKLDPLIHGPDVRVIQRVDEVRLPHCTFQELDNAKLRLLQNPKLNICIEHKHS